MGHIYKITNLINQKSYIGQTNRNPYQRWNEHQNEAKRWKNRPLYFALNKYGVVNFSFEIIEETDNLIEREIYWINFYHTYHFGYNATLGGEGTTTIDVNKLIDLYSQGFSCSQIAIQTNHYAGYIADLLRQNGITVKTGSAYNAKIVLQYSMNMELLNTFPSISAATRWCIDNKLTIASRSSHIGEVCNRKKETAYGFIWRYPE